MGGRQRAVVRWPTEGKNCDSLTMPTWLLCRFRTPFRTVDVYLTLKANWNKQQIIITTDTRTDDHSNFKLPPYANRTTSPGACPFIKVFVASAKWSTWSSKPVSAALDIASFNVTPRSFSSAWPTMVRIVFDVADDVIEGIEVELIEKEGRFVDSKVVVWERWWLSREPYVVHPQVKSL